MKHFLMPVALLACFASQSFAQDLNATVASQSGDFARPVDATPDPDGNTFYFTAIGPTGAGVFRVAATGGPATRVFAGAPLVRPTGISISSDGRQLFIADPDAWAGGGRLGQIFVLSTSGGSPLPLRGAAGTGARGIELISQGGQDAVYFTGHNSSDRTPGIYRISASGADSPTVVLEGAPLVEPDSVAIGRFGAVYVTDRGVTPFTGKVYKVDRDAVSTIVDIMRPGNPAGLAVSLDESRLLVSTLQPYRTRAQVLVVDLATLETSASTQAVGQNPGAGGLHRARNVAIYSWCGSPRGPVFKIMAAGMAF